MKDRIKKLMESQNMNQQSFASYIGISTASLSSILQERTRPTLKTVEAICGKFPNVSLSWLISGEGEMYNTGSGASPISNTPVQPDLFHQNLDFDSPSSTLSEHLATSTDASPFSPVSSPSLSSHDRNRDNYDSRSPYQKNVINMKNIDKDPRRITEIRVFYDDQTWESFVPKK